MRYLRPCLLVLGILATVFSLTAQTETTFHTNGPDDYREGLHAFVHATIFKDYKTKLEDATLLIRDGKVVDVGNGIAIPQGAMVHDMKGKFIYPSFIDVYSSYGQPDVKKPQRSDAPQMESNIKGAYGWNQAIHADYDAVKNFVADDKKADEYRKLGFGTVQTLLMDGIARGTGAVVTLGKGRENELVVKSDASAGYSFDKGSSTQNYPESLMGAIALLRQTYYDAQWYKNATDKKEYNLSLEAWNQNQDMPQIFDAGAGWEDVLRADKVGDEFGVQYIIKTDGKEYQRIDEIKNTGAKIITSLNFPKAFDVEDPYKARWVSLADMKDWELAPTNSAALAKAGIDFVFTAADLEKKEEFLPNLRKAVKYGLDSTIALKAITYAPAAFLNITDKVGLLEPGRLANFIITSKPLFDDKCEINENWVQGKRYEIKAFSSSDIRGEYNLSLSNNETYKIKLSGDAAAPKGLVVISDSVKQELTVMHKDNDITLAFNPEKKKEENKILLTGTVNDSTHTWQGKGQLPSGNWITWNATQVKGPEPDTSKPKKDTVDFSRLGKVYYPFTGYGNETLPKAEDVLFKNGTVWTNESDGVLTNADVIIKNGKITAVGKGLKCDECTVIDATGKYVTSGIIDEHSHIAISRGVNEGSEASSAEVRIGDVITGEDINIYRQLSGGVTAAQLLHGSANPIGGQSGLIKMRWGYAPEKMKIENAAPFIKFALGENVKQSNWGEKWDIRYPQTRMGVEQTYYNYFTKAREYGDAWAKYNALKAKQRVPMPRRDLELDALLEILNGKRFITCHSYVQSEINMLLHVADTFGFKMNTFTHILEGYKVADKMKAHGVYASTFADWWAYKYEVIDAIPYNAAILTKVGVTTAVNSDDAEMARRLNQEAAKTIKYGGMTEEQAWKMCTLNPAIMLHLDAHMGSIKAGKDADIVVWNTDPLSIYARVEETFVDGIRFYDSARDAQKRDAIQKERARLIQKLLEAKKGGAPTQEPKPKGSFEYNVGDEQ
ncbi:MAG TPA: amidohydrolase family protein [Chitinophagales bacterium]|nr:amidohydrolase family protein [Chitinophagales bacterium]